MHLKGANINEAIPSFSFETSVLKLMLEGMECNANRVAQIEDSTGKKFTFADILAQSKAISTGLRQTGISPGDYVVLCCRKSCLAFAVELGVMFTGAIPVLIHITSASEIHKYTSKHYIKAIFCDTTDVQVVDQSITEMNPKPILVATIDVNHSIMKTLLSSSGKFSVYEVTDIKKKVVLVLFTSGTTSTPKGVQITDLGLQRNASSAKGATVRVKSHLLTSPFSWVSCTMSLVSSLLKGYCLVLSEAKDPASQFKAIEKYKVNSWTVQSSILNLYVKEPTLASVDLSSLTVVVVAGAVARKRTINEFVSQVLKGRIGVYVLYAMTETGFITTWNKHNLLDLSKADSSGYLAPGVEVKITDEEGRLVEPGSIGEVRARTLSTTLGYWGQPELDAQSFDSDGFFKTGDVGYFDSEGFLYIYGRVGEIITLGESKVSISEIEDLLKTHSKVIDAGVVAKPKSDSYKLIVFIVVKSGCQVSGTEISEYLSEQAGDALGLEVHEVETIPKTPIIKVNREKLLSMADKLYT
ncbi:uncharacterized protein LOC129004406 isoform X1 [Macrosteles quadrilineatus]|uniref:uncharacterized protein LOC129004406 isoform X1 n=1 Tax=Macrosteles quadrilineatus TaxID=74068 RepID=UPI0023E2FAA5|nr:uncharacterized protein LOC129004406 isoform X1 [Macrosteles quadrilineatus]